MCMRRLPKTWVVIGPLVFIRCSLLTSQLQDRMSRLAMSRQLADSRCWEENTGGFRKTLQTAVKMMKEATVVIQSIRTTGGIADGYDDAIVITILKQIRISVASDSRRAYHGGVWYQGVGMSHTVKEKAKLLLRVKRVRGQVDALERALESE